MHGPTENNTWQKQECRNQLNICTYVKSPKFLTISHHLISTILHEVFWYVANSQNNIKRQ